MDEIKLAKVSYQLNQCDRVNCSQGHYTATIVEHLAGMRWKDCDSSDLGGWPFENRWDGCFTWGRGKTTGYSAPTYICSSFAGSSHLL